MYELHKHEQYLFNKKTLSLLSKMLEPYSDPCCMCCPLLGKTVSNSGRHVHILDIDRRFEDIPGFTYYDVYKPSWLGIDFDLIICDPPFFKVSLSQLFAALRVLSMNRFDQPIAVTYLKRRENDILGTFAKFGLKPTGYQPTYRTIKRCDKNIIELYSNTDLFGG